MTVVFVFILGLFFGSFINVVIFRLHRKESFVKGFSKCLFCQHRLYTKDLVPLFSFLWLKGKCRYCQHKFSQQYFWVELFTALAFTTIWWQIFPTTDMAIWLDQATWLNSVQLIGWWLLAAWLIVIFVYDLKYYLILDKVSLPAIVFALILNIILGHTWWNLLLAALVAGGFFLLQFLVSKGKWIGGGDIRLGFLMGVILGWPQVITALFLAYLIGSIVGVFLLVNKKKGWGDKLPFGTFLSLATVIVLLYGEQLVNWYWSLWL